MTSQGQQWTSSANFRKTTTKRSMAGVRRARRARDFPAAFEAQHVERFGFCKMRAVLDKLLTVSRICKAQKKATATQAIFPHTYWDMGSLRSNCQVTLEGIAQSFVLKARTEAACSTTFHFLLNIVLHLEIWRHGSKSCNFHFFHIIYIFSSFLWVLNFLGKKKD